MFSAGSVHSGVAACVAVVASAALLGTLGVVPASALTDSVVPSRSDGGASVVSAAEGSGQPLQDQADANRTDSGQPAMPDNPHVELPDTVSAGISDDATVVSEDLAVTTEGEVKDLQTGETVTDSQVIGTEDTPPDPLAKTDGQSFIPVEAETVKDAVEANGGDANADAGASGIVSTAEPTVRLTSLQNNEYGAHWGSYNDTQAFFEKDGTLFAQQAKGVIDVSEWQGTIDWQAVKNAGVDGAIIRIGYGRSNGFDKQAKRNISECKRLGIPFGIYLYSYAYDAPYGADEGANTVQLLKQAGVSPGDLDYPVFYDLEEWVWTGHQPPTSPNVYNGIVDSWFSKLQAAGFANLSVYSYYGYLDTALNSSNIHSKTRWIASYGPCAGLSTSHGYERFSFSTNDRGWQYTSGGAVNGISGRVDLNAFGNKDYVDPDPVRGAALKAIASYRGNHTWIGKSTEDPLRVKGGYSQTYQNGTVFWNEKTGSVHAVKGGIRTEYAKLNWEQGLLGFPTAEEKQLKGGASQEFENGQIHRSSSGSYFTRGAVQEYWSHANWENGWLGYPAGDELTVKGGASQSFRGGTVLWNGKNDTTYAVKGGVRDDYESLRWEQGWLGFPTSDERQLNGGASQSFEGGQIHWSPSTGGHATRGAIQEYWSRVGWENGWLGYPFSEEINDPLKPGEVYQNFQGGQVHWRSWDDSTYTTRW